MAELEQEEWPDAVPDLKQEVWPDTVPDLKPMEEVADFKEEESHAFVDLEERESADSVADFEESADDAVSVDFER